jgi:hypothetical protein
MGSIWLRARSRLALRHCRLPVALVLGLGLAVAAPAGAAAATYTYTGVWLGNVTTLTHVANVTVEGLADATLVGTISNFQTSDPSYSCLNGETINVFTAPSEFPGDYVVHNGLQGSQCTYGTWTFPGSFYTVTMAAWIPQHTMNGAPLLPSTAYDLLGLNCWSLADFLGALEIITGNGDGHTGFSGSDRAYVSAQIGWNGSQITSFTPLPSYVATSTGTAYYFIAGVPVYSCSFSKPGSQLSPTPAQTSSNSFSMEVKAQNNVAPPPLNPPLDGSVSVTVSGSAAHPTFSFSGTTELFPSYGVSISGASGSQADTLFDASVYGDPIPYEELATFLSCHLYSDCASVSGHISF